MPSCLCTLDVAWGFTLLFSTSWPSSSLFTSPQSHRHVSRFVFFSLSLLSLSLAPFVLPGSAAPASVLSVGSTGSETVTQSSLVIGHGHANQTGRNLQLIRILPPAIIVPHQPPTSLHSPLTTPHPGEINYIPGSIPTIGFPVLNCIIKGQIPRQHSLASFSITGRRAKS